MNFSELKTTAREALKGNYGICILALIINGILLSAAGTTIIGSFLLTGPLTVGYVTIYMNISRQRSATISDLFSGFENFGTTCITGILMTVYTSLWSLLFIIPGIVKSFSYAMTPYILKDNPDLDANQAITYSRKMMDGYKSSLFLLRLSFIGWAILSIFTFGLLLLWLVPYIQATEAEFYEKLKKVNCPAELKKKNRMKEESILDE